MLDQVSHTLLPFSLSLSLPLSFLFLFFFVAMNRVSRCTAVRCLAAHTHLLFHGMGMGSGPQPLAQWLSCTCLTTIILGHQGMIRLFCMTVHCSAKQKIKYHTEPFARAFRTRTPGPNQVPADATGAFSVVEWL